MLDFVDGAADRTRRAALPTSVEADLVSRCICCRVAAAKAAAPVSTFLLLVLMPLLPDRRRLDVEARTRGRRALLSAGAARFRRAPSDENGSTSHCSDENVVPVGGDAVPMMGNGAPCTPTAAAAAAAAADGVGVGVLGLPARSTAPARASIVVRARR